jgi:hypothetical protein
MLTISPAGGGGRLATARGCVAPAITAWTTSDTASAHPCRHNGRDVEGGIGRDMLMTRW